ncbi:MAG: 50S ribosomal protein L3 [Waddliaceae bacterium]
MKQSLPKLMGIKRGMTQLFNEEGSAVPCTVIEVEPNIITQIKTVEKDGYSALQSGFGKVVVKDERTMQRRVNKPQLGHFAKSEIEPRRYMTETRLDSTEGYELRQEVGVSLYSDIEYVDVTAISKGKGFQGAIKLHNFKGGPAAHGSKFHRALGSTGMRSTPGRCFKGGKRASHMGLERVTVQSLQVVQIDVEENVIVVKGAVPGPRNGRVVIGQAVKRDKKVA